MIWIGDIGEGGGLQGCDNQVWDSKTLLLVVTVVILLKMFSLPESGGESIYGQPFKVIS